jgi:hypothetical protein
MGREGLATDEAREYRRSRSAGAQRGRYDDADNHRYVRLVDLGVIWGFSR